MSNISLPDGAGSERKTAGFQIVNGIGKVLCLLLLFPLVVTITLVVNSYVHPDLPPNFLGWTPLIVETGSMSPFFDGGDLVIVRNDPAGTSHQVGDVICFKSEKSYITHRIASIETDKQGRPLYTTQGDANNTPDVDRVKADQILGSYKGRIPGLGAFALFMQTPQGMITCVIVPLALVCFVFWLADKIKARTARKKDLLSIAS